jgi:hypothetical protein
MLGALDSFEAASFMAYNLLAEPERYADVSMPPHIVVIPDYVTTVPGKSFRLPFKVFGVNEGAFPSNFLVRGLPEASRATVDEEGSGFYFLNLEIGDADVDNYELELGTYVNGTWVEAPIGLVVDHPLSHYLSQEEPDTPLPPIAGATVEVTCSPNPIVGETAAFEVTGDHASLIERMKVDIYDMAGRLVATVEAGGSSCTWDVRGSGGRILSNGAYMYVVAVLVNDAWVATDTNTLAILR